MKRRASCKSLYDALKRRLRARGRTRFWLDKRRRWRQARVRVLLLQIIGGQQRRRRSPIAAVAVAIKHCVRSLARPRFAAHRALQFASLVRSCARARPRVPRFTRLMAPHAFCRVDHVGDRVCRRQFERLQRCFRFAPPPPSPADRRARDLFVLRGAQNLGHALAMREAVGARDCRRLARVARSWRVGWSTAIFLLRCVGCSGRFCRLNARDSAVFLLARARLAQRSVR